MKILVLMRCDDCDFNWAGYCNHSKVREENGGNSRDLGEIKTYKDEFPEWCPLEDYVGEDVNTEVKL